MGHIRIRHRLGSNMFLNQFLISIPLYIEEHIGIIMGYIATEFVEWATDGEDVRDDEGIVVDRVGDLGVARESKVARCTKKMK